MASLAAADVRVAYKVQSAKGTPSSGSGGKILAVRPGGGFRLNQALATSQLLRGDGMTDKPRFGSISVPGTYDSELLMAMHDEPLRAVLRAAAETATFNITNADTTNVTITGTGTVITAGSGSWVSLNVRAGMMGKFASLSVAGNNDVWFPILAVTATTLTVPSGYLADNTADTSYTLTIAKSVSQPTSPTERYFTFDDYKQGIDLSWTISDVKLSGFRLSVSPDEPAMIGYEAMGLVPDLAASGSSPVLTSPTDFTGRPLYLADGAVFVNGTAVFNITGLTLSLAAAASTLPVVGTRTSPDVFLGNAVLSGSYSGSIEDDSFLNLALNETQVSMMLIFAERKTDPADFISFYFGDLGMPSFEVPSGAEGGAIQTLPIVGGKDNRGTGYAATQVLISSSSAAL